MSKSTLDSKGIHLVIDIHWEFREQVTKVIGQLPSSVEVVIMRLDDDG